MVRFGAALPPIQLATDTIGVHAHAFKAKAEENYPGFLTDADLDAMKAAGLKTVRTDLMWGQVERRKGEYDFSGHDRFVAACLKKGLRPMMILGLHNPLYAEGLTAYPASVRQAFERYAKAAVSHFKGKGIIWELVQQPNHDFFWQPKANATDYGDLAVNLLPELHKLDPQAHFIAPSLAGHDLSFQEALYRKGLLNHVDAVSVHPYRTEGKPPETILDRFKQSQALIQHYAPANKKVPLLLGEWGYNRQDVDADKQANYAVRQYLLGMMLRSPVNIWHYWKGDIMGLDDDPAKSDRHYSLVNHKLKPYPAYEAVKTMAQALQGQRFVKRVPLPNPKEDFVLWFENDHVQTFAAWTTGKPHKVALSNGIELDVSEKPSYKQFTKPNDGAR